MISLLVIRGSSGIQNLYRNLNGGKAYGTVTGYFLALLNAILEVQLNGILHVLHRLLVGIALAIAPLQFRAGNKITIFVPLNNHRKIIVSRIHMSYHAVFLIKNQFFWRVLALAEFDESYLSLIVIPASA